MLARREIDSTLLGGGDVNAQPGSLQWAIAVRVRLQAYLKEHHTNVEHLEVMLRGMIEEQGWRHLKSQVGQTFKSFEQFCREKEPWGLGYDPASIDEIVRERKSAQALAASTKPLQQQGGIRKHNEGQVDNIKLLQGGTQSAYLTARIARDRPDILEGMTAGWFPSVRAAAIEAGIIKVPTSTERAQKAFLKLSTDEREAFLNWISEL
jgi:hypothetical protein